MVGLGSAYYVADKKTMTIARTTIFGAICNIALNLAMITKIGLYAASLSTVLAYFILFVVRSIDIRNRYGVRFNYKLLISGVLCMLLGYSAYFVGKFEIYVIAFIIYALYAYFINCKVLISVFNSLKRRLLNKQSV